MSSTIHQLLELGKHYSQNKLWSQAVVAFEQALVQLFAIDRHVLESFDGSQWPDLKPALEELGPSVLDLSSCTDKPILKRLHEELARAFPQAEVERARFLARRHVVHQQWILVFHDRRGIGFPELPIEIPDGKPIAFFLDMESCRLERIPARTGAQISYALSHLAWAQVSIAVGLYTFGRILIADGINSILTAALGFDLALLFVPNSSWALSHLGELYRTIANSWPPATNSFLMPDTRVEHYLVSMLCFHEAIRIAPDDFWAHAHFGAVVVNARVFMGVQVKIPVFEKFIHHFFPDSPPEREPRLYQRLLLDMALSSLVKAQNLQGNFYPWAQLYMADVLFLQCLGEAPSVAVRQGLLSMIWMLDGLALQPGLASGLFEPSELYSNPFFQVSQLYFWNNQNLLAWQYACLGLSRAFKFSFVPRVEVLLGYQLLATIAQQYLEFPKTDRSDTDDGLPGVDTVIGGLNTTSIPIPAKPFDKKDQLFELIDRMIKECHSVTSEFVHQSSDTNIQVSLLQVCFILIDLRNMLDEYHHIEASRARDEATKLIHKILDTCDLDLGPDLKANELKTEPVYLFGLTYSLYAKLRPRHRSGR